MDLSSTTRWGGRVGRYAQFPRAVGRCHDPYDGNQPVQFPQPIDYEAWVRWRFHPDTLSITHCPSALVAWNGRKTISATPTFVVMSRTLTTIYHLVAPRKPTKVADLHALAACTGVQAVVTSLEELRRDMALFWRLERLRSASEIHFGEGADLDAPIFDAIRVGCNTRSALQASRRFPNFQLLDARLGHLHCAGLLALTFDTDDFGVILRQEVIA